MLGCGTPGGSTNRGPPLCSLRPPPVWAAEDGSGCSARSVPSWCGGMRWALAAKPNTSAQSPLSCPISLPVLCLAGMTQSKGARCALPRLGKSLTQRLTRAPGSSCRATGVVCTWAPRHLQILFSQLSPPVPPCIPLPQPACLALVLHKSMLSGTNCICRHCVCRNRVCRNCICRNCTCRIRTRSAAAAALPAGARSSPVARRG